MRLRSLLLHCSMVLAACGHGPPNLLTVTGFKSSDGATVLYVETRPFGLTLQRGVAQVTVARTLDPAIDFGVSDDTTRNRYPDPLNPDTQVAVRYVALRDASEARYDEATKVTTFTVATSDPGRTAIVAVETTADGGFAITATLEPSDQVVHVRLHLDRIGDEHYFGLGEYFDTTDHRGKVRDVRFVVDGELESGYNEVHVPVPSYVTTGGFGLFLDNREPLVADFTDKAHLTVVAPRLGARLVAAPTPVEAVAFLQRHAGLPPLWPPWAFAPMQWRNDDPVTCAVPCDQGCNATRTGADIVLDDARQMRARKLPASVIWIDAPWMTAFNDFKFNPVQFPDAAGLIAQLRALGYQVAVWAAPFINQSDDRGDQCGILPPPAGGLFTEADSQGYFVKGANGQAVLVPWRGGQGALLDFTNPAAATFWKGLIRSATDLGVTGFKLDWDEYVVAAIGATRPDYRFADGSFAATQHATYHGLFHRAHQEALQAAGGEGFIIARSGDGSDARYATAVWPGDLDNNFNAHRTVEGGKVHVGGLPAAVNAAVSLAASAHPHFGSDIGGFRHGTPTKEVLARWIEFGALSTVMQLGGGGTHHNPWDFTESDFDQELLDVYARYARLHVSLFPYLYTYVKRNSSDGTPILRAPALAFPDDAALAAARHQYFFGEDLLVAPVVEAARARAVVLPRGSWVSWWTGEIFVGPATVQVAAPLDVLPLFVRAGAIIPLLAPDVDTLAPATDPSVVTMEMRAGVLGARVYPAGATTFTIYDGTKLSSTVKADGLELAVVVGPRERVYTFEVLWPLVRDAALVHHPRRRHPASPHHPPRLRRRRRGRVPRRAHQNALHQAPRHRRHGHRSLRRPRLLRCSKRPAHFGGMLRAHCA